MRQWLFMRRNFVFLGMHLAINKRTSAPAYSQSTQLTRLTTVYANSLLAR